jgi:hypothetical protein
MIENKINNRTEFQIYIVINLIVFVLGFLIAIVSIHGLVSHNWIIIYSFLGLFLIIMAWGLFESIINPSYFETIINEREIIIKTFTPSLRNGLMRNGVRFLLLFKFRKYLKEIKLSQREYNDYKLIIDKLGFRKILILQKINKNGIYETSEINISLLGQKKYTDLILSIDRLRGKIHLN